MKKCASCTKDLPDAALHCVFCGAKQPPAPAVAGSVAKTVMGHASNEMIEQLKAQAAAAARNAPAGGPAPYTPPAAPRPAPAPAPGPAPVPPTMISSGPPLGLSGFTPTPGPSPHGVPQAGSVAPTMFVPGGGPPMGGPLPGPMPGAGPLGGLPPPGPPMGGGMPGMGPGPMPMSSGPAPIAPIPSAAPPYMASRTAARAGRPIEPWKDSLRLMMIIWGAALLVAFMVPTSTEPAFMFQTIIDGEGTAKLGPLMIASIGLLSLVLAFIPTSPMPRGLIAGLLGFTGIAVPMLLALSKGDFGIGQVFAILTMLGGLMIVPGLLLRSQYTDSIMPRILVTIGVLCVLAPLLIPVGEGGLPLIGAFKMLIDGEGPMRGLAIVLLLPAILALLSLLVWLPAPSTAGAPVFAWLWIMLPAIGHFTVLLIAGHIGDQISASPNKALTLWAIASAYTALVGYGFATVFGKKLE